MKKTNKKSDNGNGSKKYNPDVVYRHLAVDVWAKKQKGEDREDVAYSDEIKAELDAENSSEEE